MPNHQTEVDFKLMEVSHSSGSSYDEAEYDSKIELVDNTTACDQNISSSTAANGENQVQENNTGSKSEHDDDMAMVLRRKINECGLGDMRIPELQMSGCSDVDEETARSDEFDDDLCSSSDDDNEESYNPFASGVVPPVLPFRTLRKKIVKLDDKEVDDCQSLFNSQHQLQELHNKKDIQLRVPMEDANDARRVKDALLIKGVLDVVCDKERQMVTVTGIVPPMRVLKKVRRVKPQARIISTVSPFAVFINPNFRCSQFEEVAPNSSNAIDIPTPHPVPNFVVHQQRPRPTFQRYTFHNDPHSPFLRTFSPTNLSPANSPSTADAFHHHSRLDSSFFDDDLYQSNGFIIT